MKIDLTKYPPLGAHLTIKIKLQVEGMHRWKEAGDVFPEVKFLSDLHRHLFFIECEKEVTHSERDKEFLLFKREVTKYLSKYFDSTFDCLNFDNMSCEAIAIELYRKFELDSCSVYEDNENGAICKKR